MSGSNFTQGEGVENTPPPASAVPGAEGPVLLGVKITSKTCTVVKCLQLASAGSEYKQYCDAFCQTYLKNMKIYNEIDMNYRVIVQIKTVFG